jgi:hypothetical protein
MMVIVLFVIGLCLYGVLSPFLDGNGGKTQAPVVIHNNIHIINNVPNSMSSISAPSHEEPKYREDSEEGLLRNRLKF